MITADIYTSIGDKHDLAAVGKAFSTIIAGVQTVGINPDERDVLIKSILCDLAEDNTTGTSSEEPIWSSWDQQTYNAALECIKVLSRSQAGSSSLSTPFNIQTLIFHAKGLQEESSPAVKGGRKSQHLAISAICNTLLLHQTAPELYAKAGLGDWALQQLDGTDATTENERIWLFLMGRVVMVLTSRATYGFLDRMVDQLDGLWVLEKKLLEVAHDPKAPYPAITEYMKTIYHILALYPETQGQEWDQRFNELVSPVINMLSNSQQTELSSPFSNTINILTRLSPAVLRENMRPSSRLVEAATKIFDVATDFVEKTLPPPPWKLGDAIPSPQYDSELFKSLDEVLPPTFIALVNLINSSSKAKKTIKQRVLPADLDRSAGSQPFEERSDVLGYLLRLSRSAVNHVTASAAGELLWTLCDEDASVLTEEIGYGNAAGILFNKGMPLPPKREAKIEEIPDDNAASNNPSDPSRNPITGLQQDENISQHPLDDMTEEEKEREAEKMMTLFDRMARNPTMQLAENPMKDAVRTGKIEEFESVEREKEMEEIRKQEVKDQAEAEKEIVDWKKRMGKSAGV
ncbi:hypothetical protein QFC22_001971 [Naganishia vaughanmartiniae]|uniref:Uncharacterized protein n=1 Tax=Naganishia vaughanmartiniae TaxID=1424756 RepID=A0ACC2XF56_9TREE|nr:hypothetical protein QFC22_001971 [Naganishia vaughanmartiniae]